MSRRDVIVVGAGPAGLSAGAMLAEMGLDVLVLDEQQTPGGQIYRNVENAPEKRIDYFGPDYSNGLDLVKRFRNSNAAYESGATVWQAEHDGVVCYSKDGASKSIRANYIVVATGAMERPVPMPGWTLPGVMGAGAANALAKESGLSPATGVVLAGSGPLLLLEASLLLKKGVEVKAILDTTPALPSLSALGHGPQSIPGAKLMFKGLKVLKDIRKAGVPHYKGITNIRAIGEKRVERVTAKHKGKEISLGTDLLLVHFGVIPSTHMVRQMGCAMQWEPVGRYWQPSCDTWGRTNFEQVFVAGDGAGVTGAIAAALKGELIALEIGRCLGMLDTAARDKAAAPIRKAMMWDGFGRPFIDRLFAPNFDHSWFDNDTVICRCETVTIGDIRQVLAEGVRDVNEVKIITRCGMGPCQGRMCGPALAEVIGHELSRSPEEAGLLRVRPPLKPVPLEEIAAMDLGLDNDQTANWLLKK